MRMAAFSGCTTRRGRNRSRRCVRRCSDQPPSRRCRRTGERRRRNADAIVKLIQTPAGQRPARVSVDAMNGPFVPRLNETHAQVQRELLQAMGMGTLADCRIGTWWTCDRSSSYRLSGGRSPRHAAHGADVEHQTNSLAPRAGGARACRGPWRAQRSEHARPYLAVTCEGHLPGANTTGLLAITRLSRTKIDVGWNYLHES